MKTKSRAGRDSNTAPPRPQPEPGLLTARAIAANKSRRWKTRRAELLQAACLYIAGLLNDGVKIGRATKAATRKFRNRKLGGGRELRLSKKSMKRHWYAWKHGERTFDLLYVAGRPVADIDPMFLRLIAVSCVRESKTVSEILASMSGDDRAGQASVNTIRTALPIASIRKFIKEERRLIGERKRTEQKLLTINSRLRELRETAEKKFLAGVKTETGDA